MKWLCHADIMDDQRKKVCYIVNQRWGRDKGATEAKIHDQMKNDLKKFNIDPDLWHKIFV